MNIFKKVKGIFIFEIVCCLKFFFSHKAFEKSLYSKVIEFFVAWKKFLFPRKFQAILTFIRPCVSTAYNEKDLKKKKKRKKKEEEEEKEMGTKKESSCIILILYTATNGKTLLHCFIHSTLRLA